MKSSLAISVGLHAAVIAVCLGRVSFSDFDPKPIAIHNVDLIAPPMPQPVAKKPKPEETPPPEQPKPQPEPEVEEETPVAPPKPKPKPIEKKPKPKPVSPAKPEITDPPASDQPEQAAEEIPETGEMSLDADEFEFAYYVNRIRQKIAAHWRVPPGPKGDLFCRVYFRIHRDGSVTDVGVEDESGMFTFDQAAKRAVLAAGVMPPLPREYRDEYLGVHFSFSHKEAR